MRSRDIKKRYGNNKISRLIDRKIEIFEDRKKSKQMQLDRKIRILQNIRIRRQGERKDSRLDDKNNDQLKYRWIEKSDFQIRYCKHRGIEIYENRKIK